MNEVISELKSEVKKRPVHKHKKPMKKQMSDIVATENNAGYKVETDPAEMQGAQEISTTLITPEMLPENWEMSSDSMVRLMDDILYIEDKVVVKNTGLKSYTNEPIGESSVEKEVVKSAVKFGTIEHAGKNTTYKQGDIIAFNGQGAKPIDFDKRFAIVPHFMIYGKIIRPDQKQSAKPASKNLLGRFLQGLAKRLGIGNVHQSK